MATEFLEHSASSTGILSVLGVVLIVLSWYAGPGPMAEYIFGEITPQVKQKNEIKSQSISEWAKSQFFPPKFKFLAPYNKIKSTPYNRDRAQPPRQFQSSSTGVPVSSTLLSSLTSTRPWDHGFKIGRAHV